MSKKILESVEIQYPDPASFDNNERIPAAGSTPGLSIESVNRRDFLKLSGQGALALSLCTLDAAVTPGFVRGVLAAEKRIDYSSWEDIYRNIWSWDSVSWGSHTNACSPGTCLWHVYSKNGLVWREEQAARSHASSEKYVDYNPLGCQKGCGFHNSLYSKERVKYPLKRAGERGEGKWERISWDQALTEIADSILDAHIKSGSQGFVADGPHVHAGSVASAGMFRFITLLNTIVPDHNVEIGDTFIGSLVTFGKMHVGYTPDNFFDAEMVVMTQCNWGYSAPALYHFISEARYNGTEFVMLAPDANATTHGVDIHIPVALGTDAAFWLGVNQVILEKNTYDAEFIKEQTDLPLLVRMDNGHYLRAIELGEGREDQLYFMDAVSGLPAKAPRATLKYEGDPLLEGVFDVVLKDGTKVQVTPVFSLLKKHLRDYTPEKAQEICGVNASVIRDMAAKIATRRTCCYIGFSGGKHYHGDLMERSLLLTLALTGNLGKPGTGTTIWSYPTDGMMQLASMKKPMSQGGFPDKESMEFAQAVAGRLMQQDPETTPELIKIEVMKEFTKMMGNTPSAFWLYNHVGYDELWDRPEWQDPAMKRTFGEYMKEGIEKGWWDGLVLPKPGVTPEVMLFVGTNPLRRVRSGNVQYPKALFPKLKTIFTIETRLSTSAMYADYVLPAAWYYEKEDMTISMSSAPFISMIEQAVKPVGEAKGEWEIFALLLQKIEQRAMERNLTSFVNQFGQEKPYQGLHMAYTMNNAVTNHKEALKEIFNVTVASGILPKGYTYEKFQEDGTVMMEGMGTSFLADAVANDWEPGKPFYSLRWHVENKTPYPTYARRIQFYIDHDWFLEVGEGLPTHKDIPPIGGNYPFRITSGHPRVSINSIHLTSPHLMRLHRGQPVVFMNPEDAAALDISDGETVRIFNDVATFEIMASLAATVAPGLVIVYYWEGYQFREWKNFDAVLVGQPKAIYFAGGYEQLRYFMMHGSPMASIDRGVRVGIEKI